jgi:hypothetical protein
MGLELKLAVGGAHSAFSIQPKLIPYPGVILSGAFAGFANAEPKDLYS